MWRTIGSPGSGSATTIHGWYIAAKLVFGLALIEAAARRRSIGGKSRTAMRSRQRMQRVDDRDVRVRDLIAREAAESRGGARNLAGHQIRHGDDRDRVHVFERGDAPLALTVDVTVEVLGYERRQAVAPPVELRTAPARVERLRRQLGIVVLDDHDDVGEVTRQLGLIDRRAD